MVSPQIIYEDPQIIVLDKPSGFATTSSSSHEKYRDTLAGWLFSYVGPSLKKVGLPNRWGIVHRLDKDTSGVIVCAKTQRAYENLLRQFKERKVKKTYLTLVWGKVEHEPATLGKFREFPLSLEGKFVVDAPIARNPQNPQKFCVSKDGKKARTSFRCLDTRKLVSDNLNRKGATKTRNTFFTFLQAKTLTGRTHQIRVHLQHLSHPVVGDLLYSGRKRWRHSREFLGIKRQFLHATELSFKLVDGTVADFRSELPKDLRDTLDKLEIVR